MSSGKAKVTIEIQKHLALANEIRRLVTVASDSNCTPPIHILGFETDLNWLRAILQDLPNLNGAILFVDERSARATRHFSFEIRELVGKGWEVFVIPSSQIDSYLHIKGLVTKHEWLLTTGSWSKKHMNRNLDLTAKVSNASGSWAQWLQLFDFLKSIALDRASLDSSSFPFAEKRNSLSHLVAQTASGVAIYFGRSIGLVGLQQRRLMKAITDPYETRTLTLESIVFSPNQQVGKTIRKWCSRGDGIKGAWLFQINHFDKELASICDDTTLHSCGFLVTKTLTFEKFRIKKWSHFYKKLHAKVIILRNGNLIFTSANWTYRSLQRDIEFAIQLGSLEVSQSTKVLGSPPKTTLVP